MARRRRSEAHDDSTGAGAGAAGASEAVKPTNAPTERDFLHHLNTIGAIKQQLDDINSELRNAYKTAEEGGLDKAAIKAIIKLKKQDPLKTRSYFEALTKYSKWAAVPIGTQFSLLSEDEAQVSEDTQAKAEGRRAGLEGKSLKDNPYPDGSRKGQVWDESYRAAQAELTNEAFGGSDKKAA